MKYVKKQELIEADEYTDGMEDGFIKSSSELAVCWQKRSGAKYKGLPYITTGGGRQYLRPGRSMVVTANGARYIVDKAEFLEAHEALADFTRLADKLKEQIRINKELIAKLAKKKKSKKKNISD